MTQKRSGQKKVQKKVSSLGPHDLWYVSDRRIRTEKQSREAARIAREIARGQGDEEFDQDALFVALQTCAYRAARPTRGESISQRQRRRWAERWRLIRSRIVEQNLGLVHWMTYRLHNRYGHLTSEYEDLQGEGMLALTRAVDRFNPWRGFQFSTYASNVIARAIMRSVKRSLRRREETTSIGEDLRESPAAKVSDLDAEVSLEHLEYVRKENLAGLSALELRILEHRFPRDESDRMTFREIGSRLGLSKERVRQIQNEALDKLRTRLILDSAA